MNVFFIALWSNWYIVCNSFVVCTWLINLLYNAPPNCTQKKSRFWKLFFSSCLYVKIIINIRTLLSYMSTNKKVAFRNSFWFCPVNMTRKDTFKSSASLVTQCTGCIFQITCPLFLSTFMQGYEKGYLWSLTWPFSGIFVLSIQYSKHYSCTLNMQALP